MRAWVDDKRDELAATFPTHDIWFVPEYGGHVTWCSRPKGHPIATLNRGSAGELEKAITEELARTARPAIKAEELS
jgi:hypothetical protein